MLPETQFATKTVDDFFVSADDSFTSADGFNSVPSGY